MAASHFIGETFRPKVHRPLKVIVFSQFRKVLDYFGNHLIRRFGGTCVAEYWGKTRNQELRKFAKSSKCFCMFLSKDGSHGLDLSFVTHIFFLDTIYDKSLESQVVARAYRMGAKGHVEVEQLIARHSVEELIAKMSDHKPQIQIRERKEKGSSNNTGLLYDSLADTGMQEISLTTKSAEEKQVRQAKLHYLLKGSKLINNSTSRRKHARPIGDEKPDDKLFRSRNVKIRFKE